MKGTSEDRGEEAAGGSTAASNSALADDPRLVPVHREEDVLERYRGTPIEDLIEVQNLDRSFPVGEAPTLFIATCIDSRVRLKLPPGAAFELRSAGVNLRQNAFFQIAFAVSVAPIQHIALISHDDCAMSKLPSLKDAFVEGLAEQAEWSQEKAAKFFRERAANWHQEDPIVTVLEYARDLRKRLPSITFAPLHYSVQDGRLYQIRE
jgi:carbonic anhydrase